MVKFPAKCGAYGKKVWLCRAIVFFTYVATSWPTEKFFKLRLRQLATLAFLLAASLMAAPAFSATVDITVNWPSWASDNRILLKDSNNSTLATICDPVNCFNSVSSTGYNQTYSYTLTDGATYSLQMDDSFGDSWNSTGTVTVTVNGSQILTSTGPASGNASITEQFTASTTAVPSTASPTGPAFSCSPDFYLVDTGQLQIFNAISGTYTNIGPAHDKFNAIGYNPNDNYIYGLGRKNTLLDHLIRINSNGTIQDLGNIGTSGIAGDMDRNNNLYFNAQQTQVSRVNVKTGVVSTIPFTGSLVTGTNDVVFIDDGGNGVLVGAKDDTLNYWDLNTNTTRSLVLPGLPVAAQGGFGAGWAARNGRLFLASNTTGVIYEIDDPLGTPSVVSSYSATTTRSQDGAGCPLAPSPTQEIDTSDAPISGISPDGNRTNVYGEAQHDIDNSIFLGATVDADTISLAHTNATGDDSNGSDDEDGISAFPTLTAGDSSYILSAANITGTGVGTLHAWIDFDGDGSFETTEYTQVGFINGASGNLSWTGQNTMGAGTTFARFRLTTDALAGTDAVTSASNGEVEDYTVTVSAATPSGEVYDFGDAPNDLSAIDASLNPAYPTLTANNGASHTLDGTTFLGAAVDDETDGQPSTSASDDNDDGVVFPTLGAVNTLMLGQSNTITVTASTAGFLNVWMDINQDGDWDDSGEQLFTNQSLSAGSNALSITPTITQPTGDAYLRFRFTSTSVGTPLPTGLLPDGEVEDYRVAIVLPEPGACSSALINGGFEDPAAGFGEYNEDVVPGWATLANSPSATSTEESNGFLARNRIEIWNSGFNGVPSYTGNQFAELNAHVAGSLYQDLETTPGTVITYQFAHRGRSGNDTLDVLIGPPTGAISQTSNVGYTTGNTAWQVYTGTYTVPPGQVITRFAFKAISSASGVNSVGNFVDDVQFGFLCNEDYSDAPADGSPLPNGGAGTTAYGEAKHTIVSGIQIGSTNDSDASSIANSNASGDGAEDDGLITLPTLTESAAYTLQVAVTGIGRLSGWIDYDGDGSFDADDSITGNAGIASSGGTIDLPIHIPAGTAGTTFLRLRYSSDTAALSASGDATDGEVEDYQITILPKITNPIDPGTTPTVSGVCSVYNATGVDQLVTAPTGAQGLKIKMWGAGGGHEIVGTGYSGAGGYSEAQFDSSVITPGDVFSLVVGRGGNTSGRPSEFSPSPVYGFGSVSGHDQGGGLTGLFTGNTTVLETDQARALVIAGGGGGYEHSGDAGTGVSGGNGHSASSGGQPTMRGSTDVSPSYNGLVSTAHRSAGGGGYYGGGRLSGAANYSPTFGNYQHDTAGGAGGAGYVDASAVAGRLLSTPDGTNTPPNTTDADYIAGIGAGTSSTSATAGGNGLAVLCWDVKDYSDAPATYGDPTHQVDNNLHLGDVVDAELAATPGTAANSDGVDDDGVGVLGTLSDLDRTYSVDVEVTNQTGSQARLVAWIDFDGNGTFDADEAAIRNVAAGTVGGIITLRWSNIPLDIQTGDTFLRVRLTTDTINNREPDDAKGDGEVEDYTITIVSSGVTVSGRVYVDTNSNATNDSGELGIGNTVVVLRDSILGVCRSSVTSGSGDYSFAGVLPGLLPGDYEIYQAHGETVPVPQSCGTAFSNNPTGYQSTTDDVLYPIVASTDVVNQDFGEVAGANSPTSGNTGSGVVFEPDNQSEVLPGNTVFYTHSFVTEANGGTDGQVGVPASGGVRFTTTDSGNITPGWTHTIYRDSDCNGSLNGAEGNAAINSINFGITAGSKICLINKVFAPANVPAQDRYEVKTTATFTYTDISIAPITLAVTDLTIAGQSAAPATPTTPEVGASRLELTKKVINLNEVGAVETMTSNQAKPGDILQYRIYYRNTGTGPVTDLKINDSVPDYTGLVNGSVLCNPVPTGMGCTPSVVDFTELSWDFTGPLVGGAEGYVSYEVMVDN